MTYRYAQTNVQLYNQLRELEYEESELVLVRRAYELAMRLFSGCFHPCGKPLVAHHVGVASILAEQGLPAYIVAAGILHAVYAHGDFGPFSKGPSRRNRRRVRSAIGKDAEEIVFEYRKVDWPPRGRADAAEVAAALEGARFYAYLMQVANALEDHLDLGVRYCKEFDFEPYFQGDGLEEIATVCERMQHPGLAQAWREVVPETAIARIPESMRRPVLPATKYISESYRPMLIVRVRAVIDRLRQRMRSRQQRRPRSRDSGTRARD